MRMHQPVASPKTIRVKRPHSKALRCTIRAADPLFLGCYRYTNVQRTPHGCWDAELPDVLAAPVRRCWHVGWRGLLSISELLSAYNAKYGDIVQRDVMEFMVKDEENPSSSLSCLRAARENARAVRELAHHPRPGKHKTEPGWKLARMLRDGEFGVTRPSSSTG